MPITARCAVNSAALFGLALLAGFMKTDLEDAEALDGLEFLSMAEAGELAHWEILAKLNETAPDADLDEIVKFVLPVHQGHVDAVREQSCASRAKKTPPNRRSIA